MKSKCYAKLGYVSPNMIIGPDEQTSESTMMTR